MSCLDLTFRRYCVPEFVSQAILRWIANTGIDTAFIDPGKPWQNGTDESFNGKFRDECLNMEWFRTRAEAVLATSRHAGLGFIAGGSISAGTTGARPIATHPTPPGTPRWGSAWKKAVARYYGRSMAINAQIGDLAYRGHYLDLDPQYKDACGLPLLRLTYDRGANERRASVYLRGVCERLAKALNPSAMASSDDSEGHYSIVPDQSTHNTGGAIMGTEPTSSAVNRYLQSWDVSNVFVVGANAFPQNAGYNPTGTWAHSPTGRLTRWRHAT